MSAWLFKTTGIGQRYKAVSALLLKHKHGKIHLSAQRLKSLKFRRSQYGLFLRMLKTGAEHFPVMSFYEDQRRIAFAEYDKKKHTAFDKKKRAATAATKATVGKFKKISSSQIRAIIKAYR
jgi:hypothetical protein